MTVTGAAPGSAGASGDVPAPSPVSAASRAVIVAAISSAISCGARSSVLTVTQASPS